MPNATNPAGTTPESAPPARIAIVGGGTAGWMSAATLRRRLDCDVTLVESSRSPGIGVGEATIPAMVDWIENMGIDEDQFLRRCGGTYKLAIRFDDWITPRHQYWHPFGQCGGTVDGLDMVHFWRRGVAEGWLDGQSKYTDFSTQRRLCEQAKSPRPIDGQPVLANYAYHLDAGLLAQFIKELAVEDGVRHRVGHVENCQRDSSGNIERIHLDSGETVEADLFIDCSGFASVLIENALDSPWVDWSDTLLCDRALTARTPMKDDERLPYTISTGRAAGWSWQIPLRDVTGHGYVYSSHHISDEEASSEFREFVGLEPDQPTNTLRFRVGYRPVSWKSNCVAIGLAAGFVEPLESTGIFLVQRALDELVDGLPSAAGGPHDNNQSLCDPSRRTRFNQRMQAAYEEVRDFVLLHYVLSEREDTSFWRRARSVVQPESLAATLQHYARFGEVCCEDDPPPVFAQANHHFVINGAESFARSAPPHPDAYRYAAEDLTPLLQSIHVTNARLAATLPTHRQTLDSIHTCSCVC